MLDDGGSRISLKRSGRPKEDLKRDQCLLIADIFQPINCSSLVLTRSHRLFQARDECHCSKHYQVLGLEIQPLSVKRSGNLGPTE